MAFDGKQFKKIHEAMLHAFPNRDSLARLVRFNLNQDLQTIIRDTDQSTMIFELLEWADAHGNLDELLDAAIAENPGNKVLRTAVEQFYAVNNRKEVSKPLETSVAQTTQAVDSPIMVAPASHTPTRPHQRYKLLVTLITGGMLIALLIAWRVLDDATPTFYYIVDATQPMEALFPEVRNQVQIAAAATSPKIRVGLRVYGGDVSGSAGCSNTSQLLAPRTFSNPASALDAQLVTVQPKGVGSLTEAVIDAIDQDVPAPTSPTKLIIITSKLDLECESRVSSVLKNRARTHSSNLEVLLISIGLLAQPDKEILDNYATSFQGHHINIILASDLHGVIKNVADYGSNYFGQSGNLNAKP